MKNYDDLIEKIMKVNDMVLELHRDRIYFHNGYPQTCVEVVVHTKNHTEFLSHYCYAFRRSNNTVQFIESNIDISPGQGLFGFIFDDEGLKHVENYFQTKAKEFALNLFISRF